MLRECLGQVDVVVEPVRQRWPDGQLRLREQLLHGLRHQVRRAVEEHFAPLGILGRHQPERHVLRQGSREVHQYVVHVGGHCRLGQSGADPLCHLKRRGAAGHFHRRSVGQTHTDRVAFLRSRTH